MGGRNSYLLAGARPDVWSAAVVFYGGNIMKAWGDGPAPFELTERIQCPLIGFFGAGDDNPFARRRRPHRRRAFTARKAARVSPL